MTDLSDLLASEAAVWMHLKHPSTFEPLMNPAGDPMRIALWGNDSLVMDAVEEKLAKENLDAASRRMRRSGQTSMTLDAEVLRRQQTERLSARVDGWEGMVYEGKNLVYNDKNKKMLCTAPGWRWLRDQIEAFAADEGNFIRAKTI